MCELSDQIKFCTCKVENKEKLKNYWVFYRYDKNRTVYAIGTYILPSWLDKETINKLQDILLKRVNEDDVFDIDLRPQSKDRLEVVINSDKTNGSEVHIGFEFRKGKWIPCKYDSIEWTHHHSEAITGKLK